MQFKNAMGVIAGLLTSVASVAAAAPQCTELADVDSGQVLVRQGDCATRYAPQSTFKIAISLMGYDSGVLRDLHAPRLPFKPGYVDWMPSWRSATDPAYWMQNSVVWYSQQVTRRVGARRFAGYVQRFGYGNADVAGDPGQHNGLRRAWLNSSLRISPDEQIGFLRRLLGRELGVSARAYEMTAQLIKGPLLANGWQVYGKTGSAAPEHGPAFGWYVGWAVKDGRTVAFARFAEDAQQVDGPAGLRVRDAFLQQLPAQLDALPPAQPGGLRAVVEQAIRPLMVQYQVPGMAVGVTVNGQASIFTFGVAARDAGTPVSESTLFELGSVSKIFTGTLALWAQEQGKLSLQDHPGRYLPALRGAPIDRASLLELGTYTAGGLPLQVPEAVHSDADWLAYLQHWQPLAAPGAQRQYSNPSIGLLGRVTAQALGSDFRHALEEQLLPRLGLHSSYVVLPDSAKARYAWGYNRANRAVHVVPEVLADEAYGVKASVADMVRLLQVNLDPGQLAPQLARAVQSAQSAYFRAGPMLQGLGWERVAAPWTLPQLHAATSEAIVFELNPVERLTPALPPAPADWYHKTGSTSGFGAYLAFVPAQQAGVVILANRSYPIPARIVAAHAMLTQIAKPAH